MTLQELEYKLDNYYDHLGIKEALNRLGELQAEYDALFDSGGALKYDGMPHSPDPGNPPLDAVIRMDDRADELRLEINRQIVRIYNIHRINEKIEEALGQLDPREHEIIHLRHCERMEWKQIGRRAHYSERWTREKYYSALRKIIKIF